MKTRCGQRVTKAMVEALAKEAEAGYNPRSLRPKRVGRPSLGRGISRPVHVRLNRDVHAQLQKAAMAKRQTVVAYIRAIVEDRLAAAKKSRRKKAAGTEPFNDQASAGRRQEPVDGVGNLAVYRSHVTEHPRR